MEDGEEDDYDDNNIPADWVEGDAFSDDPMGKCGEGFAEDEPVDELGQVLQDARKESKNAKEAM